MALILPPVRNRQQNTVCPAEPREHKCQPGITLPARSLRTKPGSLLSPSPLSELQPGPASPRPSEGEKRWNEFSSQKSPGRGGNKREVPETREKRRFCTKIKPQFYT